MTINPSGQPNIVRIVSPAQLAGAGTTFVQAGIQQPQQQQQPQPRFILNRLPNGTTIINPSGFVMAAPAGGVQFAGQPQIITTVNPTLTTQQPQQPNTTTFVTTPAYR